MKQIREHQRPGAVADLGLDGVFFEPVRMEQLFHLGGNALNGKPPGQDGGLHDEVKPVPPGNTLQLAALPIIDLQILRVDGTDVPWRKITVLKRGANGLSRECRVQDLPRTGIGSGGFGREFLPGWQIGERHK